VWIKYGPLILAAVALLFPVTNIKNGNDKESDLKGKILVLNIGLLSNRIIRGYSGSRSGGEEHSAFCGSPWS